MNTPDSSTKTIPQACAIPFRRNAGRIEFCLITSLKKKRWMFPKGIVDPGETVQQTALKEAFEEAGLRGRIVGAPLGVYQDAKWGATLAVTVLLMEVTGCDDDWHEGSLRNRRWVEPALVSEMVLKKELKHFANLAVSRITASSAAAAE
jgi:8-oxo-dGTP pyrophosphatase MutT (NUDIX family)